MCLWEAGAESDSCHLVWDPVSTTVQPVGRPAKVAVGAGDCYLGGGGGCRTRGASQEMSSIWRCCLQTISLACSCLVLPGVRPVAQRGPRCAVSWLRMRRHGLGAGGALCGRAVRVIRHDSTATRLHNVGYEGTIGAVRVVRWEGTKYEVPPYLRAFQAYGYTKVSPDDWC